MPPPPAPPAAGAEEKADGPATVRTANFVVHAPSRRIARLVADAAEQHRKAQALRWLGKEMPPWPEPCPVQVTLSPRGAGGATSFAFDQGKVKQLNMELQGSLDRILATALPHEVTHTVFAHAFGRPVPRWADEGAATLSEDEEEQQRYDQTLRQILSAGRAIPLRRLLPLSEYPADVMALFVQGHSLTCFLVWRKDHKTFVTFVKQGAAGDWDQALQRHYGYRRVEELEEAWLAQVRQEAKKAAETPEARRERPAEAGVQPKARLAGGLAPFTGVAVMNQEGRITVRIPAAVYEAQTTYVQRPVDRSYEPVTGYVRHFREHRMEIDARKVQAFDAAGKALDGAALSRLLRAERPVLVAAGGRKVDPFYLQVVKEGTVVLVPPAVEPVPAASLPAVAPPAVEAPPAATGKRH